LAQDANLQFVAIDTAVRYTDPYLVYRNVLSYSLGFFRGSLQIDLPFEPMVRGQHGQAPRQPLRITPAWGQAFSVNILPLEYQFAEKLHCHIKYRSIKERSHHIRFYYDLYHLTQSYDLDLPFCARALRDTFANRATRLPKKFSLPKRQYPALQSAWQQFMDAQGLGDAPRDLALLAQAVNQFYLGLPALAGCPPK
jgi:hypothetical protein